MSFVSVFLAYFAAMLMAGNIQSKWLAFVACPLAAFGITLIRALLSYVFFEEALVSPFHLLLNTLHTLMFVVIFLIFGYWRVSRQKAQSADHSSSCSNEQSDPR